MAHLSCTVRQRGSEGPQLIPIRRAAATAQRSSCASRWGRSALAHSELSSLAAGGVALAW
eukprot:243275-Pleurochrysis_carterae.AAC.1